MRSVSAIASSYSLIGRQEFIEIQGICKDDLKKNEWLKSYLLILAALMIEKGLTF
jgi:hypothetical protein